MNQIDPRQHYRVRFDGAGLTLDGTQQRLTLMGRARVIIVLIGLLLVIPALEPAYRWFSPWWLAVPAAAFGVATFLFGQASRRRAAAHRALRYYDNGLARVEDRWQGRGIQGTTYLQEDHLFAADLDLFGPGSLFERMCDARTRVGRDALAKWLLAPAPPEVVHARQDAVRELAPRVEWRERLALHGDEGPLGIETAGLARWGPATGPFNPTLRWIGEMLVYGTALAALGWYFGLWSGWPIGLGLLVQAVFAVLVKKHVVRAEAGLETRSRELFYVSQLLVAVEQEKFASARLRELQARLAAEGPPPSQRLAKLMNLLAWLEAPRNQFFGLVAPFVLWTTRTALAIEAWRQSTGPLLATWLEVVGEVEALNAVAGYAFENPTDVFPDVVGEGPCFEATGLAHPLLPRTKAVANGVCLNAGRRLLLVSGSNMSGKSTFLRTVGINTVLALAGAPVRATGLKVSPLAVGATLRIQDSLQAGRSRFFTEIRRLKAIVELTRGPLPVLFLLDEILNGTNSHDRLLGAQAIVRGLLERPSLGLVTTHDLALTRLVDELAGVAANVHFQDDLQGDDLHFDYRLRPGVVEHSNALALMRAVGLKVEG